MYTYAIYLCTYMLYIYMYIQAKYMLYVHIYTQLLRKVRSVISAKQQYHLYKYLSFT